MPYGHFFVYGEKIPDERVVAHWHKILQYLHGILSTGLINIAISVYNCLFHDILLMNILSIIHGKFHKI